MINRLLTTINRLRKLADGSSSNSRGIYNEDIQQLLLENGKYTFY